MRRTIRKRVTNTGKDRLYTIFAFFIVAPILSIVLAFALVQNVILPRLDEGQKTISTVDEGLGDKVEKNYGLEGDLSSTVDGETLGTEAIDLTENVSESEEETAETTFYGIQIGNFSSITNAEEFIKELKGNNFDNGYIVNVGNSYKVFAGEFKIKEEAYNYLENVREIYEDAFVNTVSSKDKIFRPE
ncbi:hypothetical protein DW1_2209 [Proteiniborus sp. DW1]|uniref:SPOR domain-containing protein n=1 Tax=Proteiniborus sp. DW1 TaxID=1889883 RepID=UPI00092DF383|nr:SPOR domain-containing protein [Proteiniborus sp. DW1]SCG83774.1 hypothetical protein DW1_2209 [Proteiniborus sp. DW1]